GAPAQVGGGVMRAAENIARILAGGARWTVPLASAACGEYLAERAGTGNISVEAMMLGGAFGAVAGASVTGSAGSGLVAGMLVGLFIGSVHGTLSHRAAVNPVG